MAIREKDGLRILELYSGIGGMHWALKESGVQFGIALAVDINTTANEIYKHNFPDVNLNSFGIERLTLKKLKSLRINAILMSPPCQPFSRVGKKGDCDDVRTKSFLHVLQLLQEIDKKPEYILVENVKGFESSRTRQLLIDALKTCHYKYMEYLLTPLQFGIPNSRLRYYLIAKISSCSRQLSQTSEILYSLPDATQISYASKKQKLSQNNVSSSKGACGLSQCHNSAPYCQTHVGVNENCVEHSHKVEHTFPHDTNTTKCGDLSQHSHGSDRSLCLSCTKTTWTNSTRGSYNSCQECIPRSSSSCVGKCLVNVNDVSNCSEVGISYNNDEFNENHQRQPTPVHRLDDLMGAGKNMRFCEESDVLVTPESRPLSFYMEEGEEEDFQHLLVADKDLRQFVVMDIVLPELKKSTCFAKRYGHYIEGAGSLVQMSKCVEDTHAASCFKSKAVELKNKHDWGEEELSIVRKLKLRYFSPREMANLLCFPKEFGFPESVSKIQKYRCLGNSLNVHVVARLIKFLTDGDGI